MRAPPLYARLAAAIRADILAGRLKPGDRLPTEDELRRSHGVSRITVREALEVLRRDGLIERFSGRGSFVRAPETSVTWTINSVDDIVRLPASTRTRILQWKVVPAPGWLADFFPSGERLYGLQAVRTRGGQTISYVEVYTLFQLGRSIERRDLTERAIVETLETKLGQTIMVAKEDVYAEPANPTVARRLRVRVGAPVLVQEIRFLSTGQRAVEALRVWWRADQFKRRTTLTRSR